jgi:putative phosphoesterase
VRKLAVVSDIHGNILALEAVVADIEKRGADTIVNLGDHCSGPLWPRETAEFLMQQNWVHILGNMDRSVAFSDPSLLGPSDSYAFGTLTAQQKEWLRALPACVIRDSLTIFHGTPTDDSAYLLETVEHGRARLASRAEIEHRIGNATSPLMLCGHSHVQRVVQLGNDVVVLNPGSVGLPGFQDDMPEPHVIESGSSGARYAMIEPGAGNCRVELVTVPYDSQRAADKAKKENRPDWAIALQTGFMKP